MELRLVIEQNGAWVTRAVQADAANAADRACRNLRAVEERF